MWQSVSVGRVGAIRAAGGGLELAKWEPGGAQVGLLLCGSWTTALDGRCAELASRNGGRKATGSARFGEPFDLEPRRHTRLDLEMAAPASSPAPVLPTLPLPRELTALLADHAQLSLTLSQHEDLLARLAALREARAQGHDQMNVPVDLGRGYMIEGVV